MQNKGFIRGVAILLGILCLYQLYFTFISRSVEGDAEDYAQSFSTQFANVDSARSAAQSRYLDSINAESVLNIGLKTYTYKEVKEKELNLGLDLKGGMNVILEVSVRDILINLANRTENPVFNRIIAQSDEDQKTNTDGYIDIFFRNFAAARQSDGVKLSDIDMFGNKNMADAIGINMTEEDVEKVIRKEVAGALDRVFTVLRARIDKFGVAQPTIQRLEATDRILVELPGVKNPERVKKLLQATAKLEFWETFFNSDFFEFLVNVDNYLKSKNATASNQDDQEDEIATASEDNTEADVDQDEPVSIIDSILNTTGDEEGVVEDDDIASANPFFELLIPAQNQGPILGYAQTKDVPAIDAILSDKAVRTMLPQAYRFAKFLWGAIPDEQGNVALYIIKSNRRDQAPLEGDVITDAQQDYDQLSRPAVSMQMNKKGTRIWKKMTTDNRSRSIAIVLDNTVYSAPNVNEPIGNGRSQISGSFSLEESQDLANVLKAGKLPAPANIIQSEVVGPSLGKASIRAGSWSFAFALIVILVWMTFYYAKAGLYANVALLSNMLFIFGVLASIGAVLTLPGIAGIVLTIGMSVDANVLIYERIKEELKKGKKMSIAIRDGYNNAYSSILDANITTLLTGIILFSFGTGPIQGFATTLIIGILTSLFSAIFISRLFIESDLRKGRTPSFYTPTTQNWLTGLSISFLSKKKRAYIISGVLIVLGILSLSTKGLNKGIDFVGGRTYTVKFAEAVDPTTAAESLSEKFIDDDGNSIYPEVKTLGGDNQLKISTKYLIESDASDADQKVEEALFAGLQPYLPSGITYQDFITDSDNKTIGMMSSVKVGPTIADDIKESAFYALFFSLLVIFIYILARFRKWQYSLGAVAAIVHDVLLVLALFSIGYGFLPFSLEIDQAFIAAILTVIGYSLNDTVVVFDRIREYLKEYKFDERNKVIDRALNSTLSRTINTSLTTFIVLLLIFIFGGETIRGFMFALIVGVVVGTYSSLFIAVPVVVDTTEKKASK